MKHTLMIDVYFLSWSFFAFRKHSHSFLSLLMRVLKIVEKHISRETGKDMCAVTYNKAILACEVLGEISLS